MAAYEAKMKHSAETITKLMIMRYNTFQYGRKLIRFVISLVLIAYGLYGDKTLFMPLVCLFVGCVMIANLNQAPKSLAKKVIAQMGGQFPQSAYRFESSSFSFHKETPAVPYSKLIRLIEDKQYFYLYVSEDSGYMVDRSTVSGDGAAGLKAFLAEKTGMKWFRPNSLLTFNLFSLFPKWKKRHKNPSDLKG